MSYSQPRPPAPPPVSVAQACPPWRALLLAQRMVIADEGPVRLCHGTYKKPSPLALSLTSKILIANLELESQLTHRKLSPLQIPNRKYSTIFHLEEAHRRRRPPRFLIATFTNSKIETTNCKQTRKQNSNRNKTAISGTEHPQNPRSLNENSSLDSSPLVWLRSSSLLSWPLLRRVEEEKN